MKKLLIYILTLLSIAGMAMLTSCSGTDTTHPEQRDIVDAVFASGHIATSDEYLVTANTEGYLVESMVKEGDNVTPGMQLFRLSSEVQSAQLATAMANYKDALSKSSPNSPQITQLKLQIDQAKTQLEIDQKNFNRYKNLIKTNAVSEVEFERIKLQYEASKRNLEILEKSLDDLKSNLKLNLENAENQLKIQRENANDYALYSVIKGQVLNTYKSQGELVRRGETIAKIGGGSTIIKLYIAEEDISRIQLGQETLIALNTDVHKRYEATITKIYPAFDEKEQSFLVEATFSNAPEVLYPGTQLQANIIIAQKKNALVIPSIYLEAGDSVTLMNRNKVPVKTGIHNNEWVEILEGVDTTNKIIRKK